MKSVYLKDNVNELLNKAKIKYLSSNPQLTKVTNSEVIEAALGVYVNGS